jgi:hypothetical protein
MSDKKLPYYIRDEIERLRARMEKAQRRISVGKRIRQEQDRTVDEQELHDRLAVVVKKLRDSN